MSQSRWIYKKKYFYLIHPTFSISFSSPISPFVFIVAFLLSYSVSTFRDLFLEADQVTDGNILEDILKNAALTEEDYFVAPPGNIPLEPKANYNQSNHRTEEKD